MYGRRDPYTRPQDMESWDIRPIHRPRGTAEPMAQDHAQERASQPPPEPPASAEAVTNAADDMRAIMTAFDAL